MEEKWRIELERRLREDESYQLWAKGAQNIRTHLESVLTEEHLDLLIDYAAALATMQVFCVEYAYEVGVAYGCEKRENT